MERLNRYPRGYLVRLSNGSMQIQPGKVDVADVDKDVVIEDLYELYAGHAVNRESWDFRQRVIQRCGQLYGDFYRWLILNLSGNDNIYDFNLAFIEDTVKFIRTGHRDMSIASWYELLLENPDPQPGVAGVARVKAFNITDSKEFDNWMGMWCSKPGGFDDMLCTTRVLFGVTKSPLKTAPLI